MWAAALGLLVFSLVRAGRAVDVIDDLGLPHRGTWVGGLALAVVAGLLLVGIDPILGRWLIAPADSFLGDAAARLVAAASPAGWTLGIVGVSLIADEVLFRGWLPRMIGPVRSGIAFALVKAPLDPVGGALTAAILGLVGHRSGVLAAIGARVIWAIGLGWVWG